MTSRSSKSKNDKVQGEQVIQAPLTPHPHYNQQLFSDHYLDVILPGPDRPDWHALATEAEPVLRDLQQLFTNYTPSNKEAQTEDDWIKPVLKRLGHTFEVQPSLTTPDGSKTPDYIFYRDSAMLVMNKGKKLDDTLLANRAIAVGDAKYWDRPLDISLKQTGSDTFTNKNPSYQIAFYMQHSGLEWGILTNGRLWRLYHKETAHKLDRFYEVNLPELLTSGDVHNFLYFYAFFRRQAFEPGALSITKLLEASIAHAQGIGKSLKEQVYEALRHVAQGFLDYKRNNLPSDQETLKNIYDNSLIVLYRLLFIFYAEDRNLLPVQENRGYGETYSLKSIKEDIQRNLKMHKPLLANTSTLWPQLKTLFTIIDEGAPQLGVATFNGGLFDPGHHPFLENYQIGDLHLQQAIDKLARVNGQFVDYRDLAERHLGTIYEGLLEFHLESLEQPESGWTLDLKTEKGERKASGSYYTPDYVVKYIVGETLGPVLRQAVAKAATEQEKIQAVLNVKVLDPAMGSGHFPVEATEYIARFLVEQIAQTDTGGESELAYWRRRVAQSCIYGVDLNPLAVDLAKLSLWLATVAKDRPLSFLDHHLRCGNSLVGTRLANIQTKPTPTKKSSKKTPARDAEAAQPLLFDEESLRQAMTTAVDLMWLIEINPAQTITEVKEQEHLYNSLRTQLTSKYSALANLRSAVYFLGLADKLDQEWTALANYALGREGIASIPAQFPTWLSEANALATTHRFFHWELEFPEVFFDRYGQPKGAAAGFDAVIGNPPYVRQEGLSQFKPYFAAAYPETHRGVADLYVYFYQQGLHLTRAGGRMSYIVTNKWMRSGYGEPLRAFFAQERALERIIDFGHAPIFEDADVFPCILILNKPQQLGEPDQQPERQVQVLNFPREELSRIIKPPEDRANSVQPLEGLTSYIKQHSYNLPLSRFSSAAWNLETSAVDTLLTKIRNVGVPLAEFAGVKPFYGIKTGLNEAFLIDTTTKERLIREDPQCAEIIKPYLRGQDIKRWSTEWAGLWMIVLKSSGNHSWPWSNASDMVEAEKLFQQAFPAIYTHMKSLERQLHARQDQGLYWWELRSCAYYQIFEQPKLMYQCIQFYPSYCIDSSGLLSNNKTLLLAHTDTYLLAVLNSPMMWWHNWRYLPHMKDEALAPIGELMEVLPIAQPTDAIRAETEQAVTRLIAITKENQKERQLMLRWLQIQFDVKEPGKRLENFAELDQQTFVKEVLKQRSKKLSLTGQAALEEGYTEQITLFQQRKTEAAVLERKISDLINAAYGLTAEEIALLWSTAPPRMPLAPPDQPGLISDATLSQTIDEHGG